MERSHDELWAICKKLPTDFEPYGTRSRQIGGPDCSCGCSWYHTLIGGARLDWGVCVNPASPRAGLLTFEHQGCEQFEEEIIRDGDDVAGADTAAAGGEAESLDLLFDDELPDGLARLLYEHLRIDSRRAKTLAELVKEQGMRCLAGEAFVTSRVTAFIPFIAAYDLSIIDVSEVLALPVPKLAELIEQAWFGLHLENSNKCGYHVTIKEDGNHTITHPDSLTLIHPQTGAKHYAASLGGVILETGLEHLQTEIRHRNLGAYPIPENLPEDDWWAFIGERAIVTDHPEKYLSELSALCCRVLDISRVKDLPAPELADRIYRCWVDLKLRDQASCHVILWKQGSPTLSYSHELDRIDE